MNNMNNSIKNKSIAEFRSLDTEGKIMRMAEGLVVPPGKDQNQVLEAIFAGGKVTAPARTIRLPQMLLAAAAVFLLLIGLYSVSVVFPNEKVRTGLANQTSVTLPDGSLVSLNAGSKISWNDKKFITNRQVKVEGEVYFDVQKGTPFNIKTGNGEVRILGTQLNVFSRGKEFWVSCITGKVAVSAHKSGVVLTPGEMAELTPAGLVKTTISNVEQTASWKEGVFYFANKPLVSIFGEIERQFNVSVQFDGDAKRSITVSFTNKKLEEALDVICIPMGLKYEVDNKNKVRITENNR
jgi:ferric-dicitrate binding protein FerR (iron transport regulator)